MLIQPLHRPVVAMLDMPVARPWELGVRLYELKIGVLIANFEMVLTLVVDYGRHGRS